MKALAFAPLLVVPLLFVLVLRSGPSPAPLVRTSLPDEAFTPAHCNWSCHNHGCRHAPHLPDFLTSDRHLFGATVRALHAWGDAISPDDSFAGYGAANLFVFCAAWPGAMLAMWAFALRTRARRIALTRSAR